MRLRCSSECSSRNRIPLLVPGSLHALPLGAGLEVFLFLAFAGPRLEFRRHPLVSFRSSTESVRDTTAAPVSRNDHFLEVSVLSALEASGVHSTRAYLTRYVPPAGFRTLLTAYSSPHRPALFHAGGTLRISPFEAFPFQRSRNPSGPALPACRSPKLDYRVFLPLEVRRRGCGG